MSTLTSWWSGEGSESGEVAATSSETPLLDAAASETAQTTAPVVEAPGRSHPLHAEDKVWADGFTMDDWRAAQAHQDDIMSRYNHLSVDGMELDTPYRINTVKAQTKQFGQAFGMEEQHSLLTGETEIPNYWSNPVLHAVAGKGSPEDIETAMELAIENGRLEQWVDETGFEHSADTQEARQAFANAYVGVDCSGMVTNTLLDSPLYGPDFKSFETAGSVSHHGERLQHMRSRLAGTEYADSNVTGAANWEQMPDSPSEWRPMDTIAQSLGAGHVIMIHDIRKEGDIYIITSHESYTAVGPGQLEYKVDEDGNFLGNTFSPDKGIRKLRPVLQKKDAPPDAPEPELPQEAAEVIDEVTATEVTATTPEAQANEIAETIVEEESFWDGLPSLADALDKTSELWGSLNESISDKFGSDAEEVVKEPTKLVEEGVNTTTENTKTDIPLPTEDLQEFIRQTTPLEVIDGGGYKWLRHPDGSYQLMGHDTKPCRNAGSVFTEGQTFDNLEVEFAEQYPDKPEKGVEEEVSAATENTAADESEKINQGEAPEITEDSWGWFDALPTLSDVLDGGSRLLEGVSDAVGEALGVNGSNNVEEVAELVEQGTPGQVAEELMNEAGGQESQEDIQQEMDQAAKEESLGGDAIVVPSGALQSRLKAAKPEDLDGLQQHLPSWSKYGGGWMDARTPFLHQREGSDCFGTCQAMLLQAGLRANFGGTDADQGRSGNAISTFLRSDAIDAGDGHVRGIKSTEEMGPERAAAVETATNVAKSYIDEQLFTGNPVMIGVSYENKSGGGDNQNGDGLTDHWCVITRRDEDGGYWYADPATGEERGPLVSDPAKGGALVDAGSGYVLSMVARNEKEVEAKSRADIEGHAGGSFNRNRDALQGYKSGHEDNNGKWVPVHDTVDVTYIEDGGWSERMDASNEALALSELESLFGDGISNADILTKHMDKLGSLNKKDDFLSQNADQHHAFYNQSDLDRLRTEWEAKKQPT